MNRTIYIISMAALALVACNKMGQSEEQQIPVSLCYSSVEAADTKAAQDLNSGTFASGETIKVQISNTGAGVWTGYDFTTGNAGAMTPPTPGPYYPAGSTNIDIAAFYPSTAGSTFSVATDQTADASYKASDLMFASVTNQAKQVAPVNLSFNHKMAKLNVNITAGDGVSSITSVSILNVKPTVSFNQTSGEVGEASGVATSILMSNNGAAVIPAQTIDGNLLSIVTDQGTATYSVTGKEFVAGNQYTINITVNLRAVGTTTAITAWTSEGTVNVYPVVQELTVLNVTAEHKGWIITTDGYVYQNKAAVDASGKTGAAMIFYVGAVGTADSSSPNFRGLAIALGECSGYKEWGYYDIGFYCLSPKESYSSASEDMSGLQNTMSLMSHKHSHAGAVGKDDHEAAAAAISYEPKAPAGTSGWFLGALGQWNLYLHGLCNIYWNNDSQGSGNLDTPFIAAGYSSVFSGDGYWTSTEAIDFITTDYHNSTIPAAWQIDNDYQMILEHSKAEKAKVKPFLAF